jgi:UDP-N-acetylglucosamine--N-acetylmuramyl-(pentapeptide) pyrophosphoryl-undecaprenol N-acetylglucosamine transferase
MEQKLKVAIACGGTGGHIFPGLATGYELLDRGHDVTLWLAGKDIEGDAVKEWRGKVITIPSEGFQFGISLRSVRTVYRLFKAYKLALREMRKDQPDVVLAMGSYASFGPVSAAKKLKIPYVLHEANLLPGRAISLLARNAHTVAVSFEKTRFYLKHRDIITTGMPLRRELHGIEPRPPRARAADAPLQILVMGGSRGARVLNEVVPQAIAAAAKTGIALQVEHIAGLQNSEEVEKRYQKAGIKANVHHFVQHMEEIYPRVDFAICRAGAATCAELACYALPALLIPYPTAIRDHQMGNARLLQDISAADVIAESDLTSSWLRDYLISISEKPERLENMASAMEKRAQPYAAGRLSDLLEKVCGTQP